MIEITMCCGLDCNARGGQELIDGIERDEDLASRVKVSYTTCLGLCEDGKKSPVLKIGTETYYSVTLEQLYTIIDAHSSVPEGGA